MTDRSCQYFECNNPECRLRFPGNAAQLRFSRCPACRSSIHVVSSISKYPEEIQPVGCTSVWRVEALLDNIRSAWNVGSIFRTADGMGIKKIYLCGITPSADNVKVSKTALGAEKCTTWEKYNNGVILSHQLKVNGYQLWALESGGESKALFDVEFTKPDSPIVMIVGNEVSGIDPGILDLCDEVISIPMVGNKQSYNVAVAFAIAASFLLYRQNVSHGSRNTFPNT